MSYRDNLYQALMLARLMSGETHVVGKMEAECQQDAVRNTTVAKRMNPDREEWEKLGFTFSEIPGDSVLCNATLPKGWRLEASDHPMWNYIYDEKGRKRGQMFYKSSFYDRDANMSLYHCYSVCSDYIDEEHTTTEIYFGNEHEKLYVAGQVHTPKHATREEYIAKNEEENRLRKLAQNFAEEYYPDYKDVTAYWDDDKELSNEATRVKK